MAEATNVDKESLKKMWKTYINDSSLFSKTTFGKYAHDKIMTRGWCWPRLYYAGTEAYDLIHQHVHHGNSDGIRRVL